MAGRRRRAPFVTLGLFLAQLKTGEGLRVGAAFWSVGLKLVVQPAVTWVIAGPILGLEPLLVWVAVVLAALPVGMGPFMLAELYGRERGSAAGALLLSTLASAVTLPVLIMLLPPPGVL